MSTGKRPKPPDDSATSGPSKSSGSPFQVVSLQDTSELAAEIGFRCQVSVTESLSRIISPEQALKHVYDLLHREQGEAFASFRAVALHGVLPDIEPPSEGLQVEFAQFLNRTRRGEEGVAAGGTMLATRIQPDEQPELLMVCQLGFGLLRPYDNPGIVISTVDEASPHVERIARRRSR